MTSLRMLRPGVSVPAIAAVFIAASAFSPGLVSRACAQGEPPQQRLQLPTPRLFDHQHCKLELKIADVRVSEFNARMTLTAVAMQDGASVLTLDAMETLTIGSVSVEGVAARYLHEAGKLTITLPSPAAKGALCEFIVEYKAVKPYMEGSGLVFLKGREATARRGALSPLIFSQGQANWNRYWIPCHDWPEEKLTTEIIAEVPAGQTVISNGRVVEMTQGVRDGSAVSRWHYLQDAPHSAYLIMLAVGTFEVRNVGATVAARNAAGEITPQRVWLNMPIYGPTGSGENLTTVFKNTPQMIDYFATLFDEPYPWDKYAQVIVRGFRWGGMENTSATVLAEIAASGETGTHDDLIAHELAHQWLGNLLTCNSWNHLWLNEGWATFAEHLWIEHQRGPEAYLRAVRSARAGIVNSRNPRAPGDTPVLSATFGDPDVEFTKADNPYSKGGFFLHMLRHKVADAAFFAGVRTYINTHHHGTVVTDDFRIAIENASGLDLASFFNQWLGRPGFPELECTWSFDAASGTANGQLRQSQLIDEANPVYTLDLPILFAGAGGETFSAVVAVSAPTQEFRVPLTFAPTKVTLDPQATVLAKLKVFAKPAEKSTQ